MTPKIYGNGYRIVQAPGYAVIMAEMIHEARVIPLDGRPHVGGGVRGYWAIHADTGKATRSSIETTNFNGKATVPGNPVLREHRAEDRRAHHARRAGTASLRGDDHRSEDLHEAVHDLDSVHVAAGLPGAAVRCHEGNLAVLQGLGGERAEDKALEEDAKRASSVRGGRFKAP